MFRALCFIAALCQLVHASFAQSTAFTYQGQLKDNGAPANGVYDFRFKLFDAASAGTQVATTQCLDNLQVATGLFAATLDFGNQFTSPASRFVEIEVRRDTGLNCATPTGFTTLTTRQLITPTPLATHAKSAFTLDAADGSPANVVFVDNEGRVGVNTLTPLNRLHVTSTAVGDGIRLTGAAGADPAYLLFNGSTPRGAIGLAASASNWSLDAAANDIVFRTESGGKLLLQSGPFASAIAIAANNNVGLGTPTPTAKLDVRGDIRLGASGQLRATSGEENLRIVRGVVNGNGSIITGSGFSASRLTEGQYRITFNTPFTGAPAFTATAESNGLGDVQVVMTAGVTTSTAVLFTKTPGITGGSTDMTFHFTAIGPR